MARLSWDTRLDITWSRTGLVLFGRVIPLEWDAPWLNTRPLPVPTDGYLFDTDGEHRRQIGERWHGDLVALADNACLLGDREQSDLLGLVMVDATSTLGRHELWQRWVLDAGYTSIGWCVGGPRTWRVMMAVCGVMVPDEILWCWDPTLPLEG